MRRRANLPSLAQRVIALDIGLWLLGQVQRLRCVHDRCCDRLAVDQPVQEIEDEDLLQRHLHCRQHGLLVMLQDVRQDLDPLLVTAGSLSKCCSNRLKASGSSVKGAPFGLDR